MISPTRNLTQAKVKAAVTPLPTLAEILKQRPLRVVFDTNVLLSMFVFPDSRFAPFRAEVDAGRWLAYTRADCLEEFRRVLNYALFKLEPERQEAAFASYISVAHRPAALLPLEPVPLPRCKDADDQKFLELARDITADWLVSSDKALLKLNRKVLGRYRILKPEEALKALDTSNSLK